MSRKKHVVELSEEERQELEKFTSKGTHRAEDINRAKILLKADDGLTDAQISEHVGCSIGTPYRTRKAYSERGIAAIHRRKPDRDYAPKLDGRGEAHLVALACSEPPEGRSRWTYALLADRLVSLEEIEFDSISEETVRQRLKKNLKPHRSEYWLIPPKENAEFVYRMETLLSLYQEPYDESRPVICFDESSKELRKHVRDPLPARPGAVARTDHHYERNGKCMLHVATEPLTGQCRFHVTERRRTCEWIDCMVAIADDYPDADRIRVVLDNLSTHNPAAFYRFFGPEKAREYLDRFEFYYTPTHGSWLNMAELVWSSLQTQCLNRRIPDTATLRSEVAAWETERNDMDVTVDWQFTAEDARTKLHRLYPTIEEGEN